MLGNKNGQATSGILFAPFQMAQLILGAYGTIARRVQNVSQRGKEKEKVLLHTTLMCHAAWIGLAAGWQTCVRDQEHRDLITEVEDVTCGQ